MSPELSVILFAYGEAENIPAVFAELRAHFDAEGRAVQYVFVDDGSPDESMAAARDALAGANARFVQHDVNHGIGAAIKSGVAVADAPWVTFMPSDGQIPPAAISTLMDARDGQAIVFSVYADRDDGAYRKLLSAGVRGLIRAVHGVPMQSDGPYLFQRGLIDPEQLVPDSFFLNFEVPIRVLGAGLPSRVVTIHCRPRRAGVSKSAGLSRIVRVGKDLFALRSRRAREARRLLLGR